MSISSPSHQIREFSVLLPVYAGETSGNLEKCMNSIAASTCLPRQVVVVEDGPLPAELHRAIDAYHDILPLDHVRLRQNVGLAEALNAGLQECECDNVARCDADDVNRADRFQRQIDVLDKHVEIGIVGSDTTEFDAEDGTWRAGRRLPASPDALERFARMRNPLNHPTIMYRRSVILSVGGYPNFHGLEDYALWVRCLLRGVKIMNIPEPLVHMRVGSSQFGRRRGVRYARAELALARSFYESGFLDLRGYLWFLASRIPVRMLPTPLVALVYRSMLR
ncbi:MAG: glycosyltransferase [Bacillota bacterium]